MRQTLKYLVFATATLAIGLFWINPASAGLIHCYLMDDGNGVTVSDSVGTVDGTLTGGGTWTTGRFGGAIDTTAGGWIVFPSTDLSVNAGSFVQWVKVAPTASHWSNPLTTHLQDPDYSPPNPTRLEVRDNGNAQLWGVPNGASGYNNLYTSAPIRDNQWHLWVFTYDHNSGKAVLYCDGLQVGSTGYSANGTGALPNWFLGARSVSGAQQCAAVYDNAAVYDHALSRGDVLRLYTSALDGVSLSKLPSTPTGQALQHLYVFDPASASQDLVLDDMSGYHGKVSGGSWSTSNPPQDRGAWTKTDNAHNVMLPIAINLDEGTYMGWFKSETSSGNWSNPIATSILSSEQPEYNSMRIEITDSNTYLYGAPGGGWAAANLDTTDGQWHHLALVYKNGSPVQLYIDGLLRAETDVAYSSSSATDRGYTMLGARGVEGGSSNWRGSVGTLAYFNYALSGSDVSYYYEVGVVPEPSSLALLTLGGLGLGVLGLRRKKK